MKYDISEFEKRVEQGFLRKSEWDDLVLYGYTDKCTFERAWDEYTLVARGLILDKETGEVVARPFKKFFNLAERTETFLTNLPKLPYECFEKVDGSLGITFNYKGEWHVATRGDFYSDQAIEAKEILNQYNLSDIPHNITLLTEIIFPENKIIVNYGGDRKLVLLGAFDRKNEMELTRLQIEGFSILSNMPLAKSYDYTIEEMIALSETLPKDEEGFVVRFENGLRVKIKGKEYLRIAKLMSSLSPIALWETMKNGQVDTFYLKQLPEELRKDYEPYVLELERQYETVLFEIAHEVSEHFVQVKSLSNWRKIVGLYLENHKLKHSSAVFPFLLENREALNKYTMKQIRPDGNNMKVME